MCNVFICLLLFTFSLLTFRFLIFFLEKSFNWWFRMEYFYKEAISRSFITKKRFLALLLQRSNFSLFYSFGMPKKKFKNFYCISRRFMSRRFRICKKKFWKKVRPSLGPSHHRYVSNLLMIISGSYRRISNVNILNERYEKLYGQIFFFLFLVPPKVVSWLLLHFNLFFCSSKKHKLRCMHLFSFNNLKLLFYNLEGLWETYPMIP